MVSAAHGCIRALNRFYRKTPALWENDLDWDGFTWLVPDDNHNNVIVFLRRDSRGRELVCAVNFSPVLRENYRFGVPRDLHRCSDPASGYGVSAGRWKV